MSDCPCDDYTDYPEGFVDFQPLSNTELAASLDITIHTNSNAPLATDCELALTHTIDANTLPESLDSSLKENTNAKNHRDTQLEVQIKKMPILRSKILMKNQKLARMRRNKSNIIKELYEAEEHYRFFSNKCRSLEVRLQRNEEAYKRGKKLKIFYQPLKNLLMSG